MVDTDGEQGTEPDNNDQEGQHAHQEPAGDLGAEILEGEGAGAEADAVVPDAPPPANNWDTGVSVAAHLAALTAKHEAELQAAVLQEQLKRLEVEKQLLAAQQSAGASDSKGGNTQSSEGSISSASSGNSRADRRKRELEWDRLQYVPVTNYEGNPFRGPDPSVHLGNRDRPQPYRLDHDPVYKELEKTRNSMRFEYEIHAPLLHYFWGINEFVKSDFKSVVLGNSTPEERAPYVEALVNSTARSLEWFSIRHALITERARALREGERDSPLLQHLQDEVYAFVGSAPPTSTWLDDIHTAFRDKVSVAQLKALANSQANAKGGQGSGAGGSGGGGGAGKGKGAKGKGKFPSLSDAGKQQQPHGKQSHD